MQKKFVSLCLLAFLLLCSGCARKELPPAPPAFTPKALETAPANTSVSGASAPATPAPSAAPDPVDGQAEALRRFRQDREDMIQFSGNLVEGGEPNMDDYGLDASGRALMPALDARQIAQAAQTAETYLKETLELEPETKMPYYLCVDPDILALYQDEDKGVLAGYDNENIFVWEFCRNGAWEYLFLVRPDKDSSWTVLHCGPDYRAQEGGAA